MKKFFRNLLFIMLIITFYLFICGRFGQIKELCLIGTVSYILFMLTYDDVRDRFIDLFINREEQNDEKTKTN